MTCNTRGLVFLIELVLSFISDLLNKGYAIKVPETQLSRQDDRAWYIPHHGVYHPQKKKLRVVFDCAACFHGTSINNELLHGPDLQVLPVSEVGLLRYKSHSAVRSYFFVVYYGVLSSP